MAVSKVRMEKPINARRACINSVLCICLIGSITISVPVECRAQVYTITTVAGGAPPPFTGDGGPALKAYISPRDVAVDAVGNIYIADSAEIRKVTANGIITAVAGGGTSRKDGIPAVQAVIVPNSLTIDGAGNIYFADYNPLSSSPRTVRKVDTSGIITTFTGGGAPADDIGDGGPATSASLGRAGGSGLATDAAGNIYVSDDSHGLVRKIALNGTISTVAGGGPCCSPNSGGLATNSWIGRAAGLATDALGNIYIAADVLGYILKVAPSGVLTIVAGKGASGFSGDGGPATSAMLSGPSGVALDAKGTIYIIDKQNHRIRAISSDGKIETIAGNGILGFSGDGGPATSATISPMGIAIGQMGRIYLADIAPGFASLRLLVWYPVFHLSSLPEEWFPYIVQFPAFNQAHGFRSSETIWQAPRSRGITTSPQRLVARL